VSVHYRNVNEKVGSQFSQKWSWEKKNHLLTVLLLLIIWLSGLADRCTVHRWCPESLSSPPTESWTKGISCKWKHQHSDSWKVINGWIWLLQCRF
jgi:hypothetical protein